MVTHKSSQSKPRAVNLFALDCGGFEIRDPFFGNRGIELIDRRGNVDFSDSIAAFSTLDEALTWLRENMAQPATDSTVS